MNSAGIMSEEEFEEILKAKKPTVVEFSATWCAPCRMFAPVMEDISSKYKAKFNFYQVDIDSAEEIAGKFSVDSVPTVLVFVDGAEVARTSGFMTYDEVERFITTSVAKKD